MLLAYGERRFSKGCLCSSSGHMARFGDISIVTKDDGGCYWYLVDKPMDAVTTDKVVQDSHPLPKNYPISNVESVKVDTSYLRT